ncbi:MULTISPECIES: hypothetical protein [unclassified Parabacteroides]|uniref:hypothetical protein n=1 Tax=unclassified Parabacteroides TaxID=2649774 RepID=UPI0024755FD0|nr:MULTISPECIES: hypothetical protein [unclassified Parabacteroides]
MKHDLQRFSDYLMKTSGFPNLQCEVKRFKPVVQLFHMLTADKENVNFSFELISFFAKLTFNSNLKISSLESYIRNYQFTPETFFEFAEYVKIYF